MEPLNQKSQIAREYGLLPADARQQLELVKASLQWCSKNVLNCHPEELPLQTIERSCYVTLLWKQNLWMATNWKRYSDFVDLIQISFNLSNVGEFSGLRSEKTVFKFRERKKIVKQWRRRVWNQNKVSLSKYFGRTAGTAGMQKSQLIRTINTGFVIAASKLKLSF